MNNDTIKFKRVSIDIDKFEKDNDLTKNTFSQSMPQSGVFAISDGTEYGYHLASNLSIYKVSSVDSVDN